MELPNSLHRSKYIEVVKELEEELKSVTSGGEKSEQALQSIQQKLDLIAGKYQNDEKIGPARYKLYDLQASIYYFDHQDDLALDFINHAIDLRGETYKKAEKLKQSLLSDSVSSTAENTDESKMSKSEKRKKLIGLEGWLAWYIVGQSLALLISIFSFFNTGFLTSSDVDQLNEYQAGLGDTIQTLSAVEDLAIFIYAALVITTLVLIFRKRKLAKALAITTLIYAAAYGVADYVTVVSIFESSGLSQEPSVQESISTYAGDVGRSLVGAFIWVPYFIYSKRVKATLTKT